MALYVWSQGTTHNLLPITLTNTAGGAVDLTSSTSISLRMRPNGPLTSYVALTGTATVYNAPQGVFTYKFASADVANTGYFKLVADVIFSDGTTNSYEQDFQVTQTT